MCFSRCAFCRKALLQCSHPKGFSPVWVLRCTLMLDLLRKPLLHIWQWCIIFLPWSPWQPGPPPPPAPPLLCSPPLPRRRWKKGLNQKHSEINVVFLCGWNLSTCVTKQLLDSINSTNREERPIQRNHPTWAVQGAGGWGTVRPQRHHRHRACRAPTTATPMCVGCLLPHVY